jgi:hypothetical protein
VCIITLKNIFEKTGGFREDLHLGEDIHYLRRAGVIGLHRHLLVPLETSGRRFAQKGVWNILKLYARITPALWLGRWNSLQKNSYEPIGEREK